MTASKASGKSGVPSKNGWRRKLRWVAELLLGVTLLVLLAVPISRSVILFQIDWLLPPAAEISRLLPYPGLSYLKMHTTGVSPLVQQARLHPNDYEDQLAIALRTTLLAKDSDTLVEARLNELKSSFADHPSLYAHRLRYATGPAIAMNRPEVDWLTGRPYTPPVGSHPPSPMDFAAFDQDALEGEQLDPDNAFFSYMRAGGLFAAHRDSEALSEILKAGQKTRWDDYEWEETTAQERLMEKVSNHIPVIIRFFVQADSRGPQYFLIRNTASITTFKAAEAEKTGHIQEGMHLRNALMHCASHMMRQSRALNSSGIGSAILSTTILRPGGSPAEGWIPPDKWRYVQENRWERFHSYLRRTGQPGETNWMAERNAAQQIRKVQSDSMIDSFPDLLTITLLSWAWMADLFLLSNSLWLLALASSTAIRVRRLPDIAPVVIASMIWLSLALWTWYVRGGEGFWISAGLVGWIVLSCKPQSPAFKINLRRAACRFAIALLLVYAGLTAALAIAEWNIGHQMDRIELHQGHWYAEAAHLPWPS